MIVMFCKYTVISIFFHDYVLYELVILSTVV